MTKYQNLNSLESADDRIPVEIIPLYLKETKELKLNKGVCHT